jgi:hypothetical protein
MESDESGPEYRATPSPAKLSKTPSWVMLGFLLGAAFVAALPSPRQPETPAEPPVLPPTPGRPAEPREPVPLTTIEAVFAEWGSYAVWSDDTTEVTLWNTRERAFSDHYEVRRMGDIHYFRSIPNLTRRVLTHGKILPDSPLQFTETEAQYREWLEYGRTERPPAAPPRRAVPPPPPPPRAPVSPVTSIDPTSILSPSNDLKIEGAPRPSDVVK